MGLCSDIVADGRYETFGETLEKLVDVISMYNTCQSRHQALVEYEKEKQ